MTTVRDGASSFIRTSRQISLKFQKDRVFTLYLKFRNQLHFRNADILSCRFKGQPITDVVESPTTSRAQRSFFPSSIPLTAPRIPGDQGKNLCRGRAQFFPTRQEGTRRKSPRAIRLKIRLVTVATNRYPFKYRTSPDLARTIYVPLQKGQSGSNQLCALYPLYWSTARIIAVRGLLTRARNSSL